MPPVLDPSQSMVDGLAFIGLSLARPSRRGHRLTVTHQTAFDLDTLQDRDYEYIFSTNDDGWLVGGGEPGPPASYKLAAPDSAHVEIMRVGTFRPEWGGVKREDIIQALTSVILIPQMQVIPTAVVANGDNPPELEIRFDMKEPNHKETAQDQHVQHLQQQLPLNWQLRFVHNQLFRHFAFPSRFCPGAFHSTILRKAEFRSDTHKEAYFSQCQAVIDKWHDEVGSQALNFDPMNDTADIQRVATTGANSAQFMSGVYLFTDRQTITHHFAPNFFPPYDTPEKLAVIRQVLADEWDEKTLSWKSVHNGADRAADPPAVTTLPSLMSIWGSNMSSIKEAETANDDDDDDDDGIVDDEKKQDEEKVLPKQQQQQQPCMEEMIDGVMHVCSL